MKERGMKERLAKMFGGKARHEARVDALNNIGNTCRNDVQRSKKEKANDPHKQRREKNWRNNWD